MALSTSQDKTQTPRPKNGQTPFESSLGDAFGYEWDIRRKLNPAKKTYFDEREAHAPGQMRRATMASIAAPRVVDFSYQREGSPPCTAA